MQVGLSHWSRDDRGVVLMVHSGIGIQRDGETADRVLD
jgi:hypothetical protein